jgi:hypothetical protein
LLVHPIWLPIILKRSTPQVDLPTERKNLLFSLICWHGCTPLATPDSRCQRGGSLLSLRKPFHVKLRRGPYRILEACMHACMADDGWPMMRERDYTGTKAFYCFFIFICFCICIYGFKLEDLSPHNSHRQLKEDSRCMQNLAADMSECRLCVWYIWLHIE